MLKLKHSSRSDHEETINYVGFSGIDTVLGVQ
jgi:hypothetical protein